MTEEALAAECFSGSFKAANAKDSKLPENRRVHVKFTRWYIWSDSWVT